MRFASLALGMALAATPAVTLACSYPPDFDQEREIASDLADATSIYEALVENVSPGSWENSWDFTVRSTESVWGATPPPSQRLTIENGACTNWFFLGNEDAPQDGVKVVVFTTPKAAADGRWLYIIRADSPTAAYFFERFGETAAGHQFRAPK